MSVGGIEIPKGVISVIDQCGDAVAKSASERFGMDMWQRINELEIKSPIEQMFYVAMHAIVVGDDIEINPEPYTSDNGQPKPGVGIYMKPQAQIGKYRVDFLLNQEKLGPQDVFGPVVVELDGHDFHDKDKRQRSYEKARDRYLVRARYRVVHFTGSDVVANPLKTAFEVFQMLGGTASQEDRTLESFDATDPFGRGW